MDFSRDVLYKGERKCLKARSWLRVMREKWNDEKYIERKRETEMDEIQKEKRKIKIQMKRRLKDWSHQGTNRTGVIEITQRAKKKGSTIKWWKWAEQCLKWRKTRLWDMEEGAVWQESKKRVSVSKHLLFLSLSVLYNDFFFQMLVLLQCYSACLTAWVKCCWPES